MTKTVNNREQFESKGTMSTFSYVDSNENKCYAVRGTDCQWIVHSLKYTGTLNVPQASAGTHL